MRTHHRYTWANLSALCIISLAAGCQSGPRATDGAIIGTGLGALTGAVIGGASGDPGAGALIGAAVGGVGGGLLGNAEDARNERDAALAHASMSQQALQAQQMALTNADIIHMSQNGLSAELIIGAINSRGGRFNTSPDAMISLSANGVDQRVIAAMQTARPLAVSPGLQPVTVIHQQPDVVVVPPPQPRFGVYFGPGPRRHHHWHHGHHW